MGPETVFLVVAIVLAAFAFPSPRGRWVRQTIRLARRPRRTRSTEYAHYINSAAWRSVRQRALVRANYRCEHVGLLGRCRTHSGLQVHHRHYRQFGHEWDGVHTHGESLQVLCHHHHSQADTKRRRHGG